MYRASARSIKARSCFRRQHASSLPIVHCHEGPFRRGLLVIAYGYMYSTRVDTQRCTSTGHVSGSDNVLACDLMSLA
jgi:hypothetical protein